MQNEQEVKSNSFFNSFSEKIATMIIAAFTLVAALAWNEAISALIDRFFKAENSIYSLFLYAIIVTIIAVIIAYRLDKYSKSK